MKIEILLPTEYIGDNGRLFKLPSNILIDNENMLVSKILEYEGGVTRTTSEGYYRSKRGIITKSKYINLVVYTQNVYLTNILLPILKQIRLNLKQECIGVVVDNIFRCIE